MEASNAILIGAAFATVGWLYTARRARSLARKQHTITVLMQAAFNKDFRGALKKLGPFIMARKFPSSVSNNHKGPREAFRLVANYYEFMAAGLRNGDFDEKLVSDSRRGIILGIFEICEKYIFKLRTSRRRQTIYEHLEWLHKRWEKKPPGKCQRIIEWIIGRPFPGKRINPRE